MAITKKKATAEVKEEQVKNEIKVTRVKELENAIMFDMVVNHVTIYGCSYRTLTRKDNGEEFAKIGFPSRKGSDGKYYSHVSVKLSQDDVADIEKQIEGLL